MGELIQIYSSRSKDEAYARCQRLGYLQYDYRGTGLARKGKNIFLSTGIWTHRGIELIARWVKANQHRMPYEDVVDNIIGQIKKGYFEYVFPPKALAEGSELEGFDLVEEGADTLTKTIRGFTDHEKAMLQQATFNEQAALVEAFIRVFVMRVLPKWLAKYRIVTIENDMVFPFIPKSRWDMKDRQYEFEVLQSATIDIVLQEIVNNKDIIVVSLKTSGRYEARTAKNASRDTQGISETWAFNEYLKGKGHTKRVYGVQMVYFIKGKRQQTGKDSGIYETHNPLIRGYRKLGINGAEYAHSLYYPKPENDSGWGRLGKGWESFSVADSWVHEGGVGGIKGWLNMLASGEIQKDCEDPLDNTVVMPEIYSRTEDEIEEWLIEKKAEEIRRAKKLVEIRYGMTMGEIDKPTDEELEMVERYLMTVLFPRTRSACHYPQDCSMLVLCHGSKEERGNPFKGGFEAREPHHKAEAEARR